MGDINEHNLEFLTACQFGDLTKVKQLMQQEKNININFGDKEGLTPLMWACRNGHIDVVKYLIKQPDLNIKQ